jgi:hypothetical protein
MDKQILRINQPGNSIKLGFREVEKRSTGWQQYGYHGKSDYPEITAEEFKAFNYDKIVKLMNIFIKRMIKISVINPFLMKQVISKITCLFDE